MYADDIDEHMDSQTILCYHLSAIRAEGIAIQVNYTERLGKWIETLWLQKRPGGPHIKSTGRGGTSEILKRTPKKYQDPFLWAWLDIFYP